MEQDQTALILSQLISKANKVAYVYEPERNQLHFVSDGFEQLWEMQKEVVLHDPSSILETIHPDDRDYLLKQYQSLLAGSCEKNIEFRIILPNNKTKCLAHTASVVVDKEERRCLTGMIEDISDIKENLSTLQKFAAKKNAILEVLSHELSGPLANIKTLAEHLKSKVNNSPNKSIEDIASIIYKSSAQSVKLIRDFVDYEFLESSKAALVKTRENLVDKVKEVVDEYRVAEDMIMKEIHFTSSSGQIYVLIDQGKFMQVLNNLISNAIKFTPDGGQIAVSLTEQSDSVILAVKDTGIGIPQKYHDELFDKFTNARREGLKGEPTLGLGMSIIKTIVEWHKGEVWFESQEHKGSAFYIRLPKGGE